MKYTELTSAERAVNRIVPIPKAVKLLGDDTLRRASCFHITTPKADYGPVKTAAERIRTLLSGKKGNLVEVVLTVEEPSESCSAEGYRLSVTADAVRIVGFGPNGLLYGVITLEQLFGQDTEIPAMEIQDWPDNHIRGIKEESRYGSNVMTEDEWMELLEDLAFKKMNTLGLALYGCWSIQYDGRISQFLYMPVEGYPELQTPMVIKYYSPKDGKWVEKEILPPLFQEDVLTRVFAKARDLGIQIMPIWNSLGHNTLIPAMYPETAPVNADGVRQTYGFCTSSEATYRLLFSVFDELIEKYMKPYGMETVSLGLDEIQAGIGKNVNAPWSVQDPWCQCEKCQGQDKGDIFINHAVKLISYLKSKGIKGVMIYCDMIQEGRVSKLGWLGDRLLDACRKADVLDMLIIDWWSYHDIPSKNWIKTMYPEKGIAGVVAPWNGYHTWSITLQPLRNTEMLAHINKRDGGKGILAYAMWDRACDRTHDAIAEYSWGLEQTGTTLDVTERYVARHFPGHEKEAYRAYRLMDHAMEQRHTKKWSIPDREAISYMDLMTYRLSPYNYSYVKAGSAHPRAFLDEALCWVLSMRDEVELALSMICYQANQAKEIFLKLAWTEGCDRKMAFRQACEAENYQVLAEDWLAILKMHDLCKEGKLSSVAALADRRYDARLELLSHWEQHKERCVAEAMGLRQQSIFMQLFGDISAYIKENPERALDLTEIRHLLSERSLWLR